MKFRNKISNLELKNNKKFKILILVEILFVLFGIIGLFGKDREYYYSSEELLIEESTIINNSGKVIIDETNGQCEIAFKSISLPKGFYKVCLDYETELDLKHLCFVTDSSVGYKALRTNGETLFKGLRKTDFGVWLLEDSKDFTIRVRYGGEGNLIIKGVTVCESNALSRMFLFVVIIGSCFLNTIVLLCIYDKKVGIAREKKTIGFALILISIIASLPGWTDYLLASGDLEYHLMRVEGIKDGILNGQFPVRIAPEWQNGYGYASSIFYGETLLYIPALFRLIGFSVHTSFKMFHILMNVSTVLISYFCFSKLFKDKKIGVICSALFSVSVYRIFKIYVAGSIGENLGMMCLPLIAYGFYKVFTGNVKEKHYKNAWIPLTIGFTGIIQSHLLTGELVGFFTIILCAILWKKVIRKETFIVLSKVVIYSILLSFWFLIPFLDYMITGDFVIQHVSARTIQYRGLYLAHLFLTYYIRGGNFLPYENGMKATDPYGVGITLTVTLLVWGVLLFLKKQKKLEKNYRTLGVISSIFALLSISMSLSNFPWDMIQGIGGICKTLVSSLQFPNRFLTISTISLTVLVGVVIKCLSFNKVLKNLYLGTMCILFLCCNIYLLNDILFYASFYRLYNSRGMGTGYIAGAEYLPYGSDATLFTYRVPICDGAVIKNYKKDGLSISIQCENLGEETILDLPLLYYKGYQTIDCKTGEKLHTYAGNNNDVSVIIPKGYVGTLETKFISPVYWRIAEIISILTFGCMILIGVIKKKNGYTK